MPASGYTPSVVAGDRLWVLGDRYTFKATGHETQGAYTTMEMEILPDHGTPPHTHTREDEGFYVLEGEIEFTVAGQPFVARAGDFVHAPKGLEHCFWNRTEKPVRAFLTIVPAGLENFFAEIGARVEDGVEPPEPDIAKVLEAAGRYGMTVAPPPGA